MSKSALFAAFAVSMLVCATAASAQPVTLYPLPSSGGCYGSNFVNIITPGPDNRIWFSNGFGENGAIDLAGNVTFYQDQLNPPQSICYHAGITAGSDGAIWYTISNGFTCCDGPYIGRFTTGGTPTLLTVPSQFNKPGYITTGPDGALWFTGSADCIGCNGRIVRLAGNQFTGFLLPWPGSFAMDIATGPDGNLWFTAETGPTAGTPLIIGRITTSGQITGVRVPACSQADGASIASGPDGGLWFTCGGSIGRISTTGVVGPYYTFDTTPYASFLKIVAGPDGALWIAWNDGNSIARLTTAGTLTSVPIPESGNPNDIIVGPDGKLWFSYNKGGGLAWIGTLPVTAAASVLLVSSGAAIGATGPVGGPFMPSSFTYSIAASTGAQQWSITGLPNWLTPSKTSGQTPDAVTFTVNANANALAAGSYNATITFTAGSGNGTQTRTATLVVGTPPALVNTATHDFNYDLKSDIAWRDTGGNTAAWLMNGAQVANAGSFGVVNPIWQIVGQRDFNGDGRYDWLWRDTSGNVAIWLLSGLSAPQAGSLGLVAPNWVVYGTSDFNGDGRGDILWRDDPAMGGSGTVAIWLMNGFSLLQGASLGVVPANWVIQATDGQGHIFWRDSQSNTVVIWAVSGFQIVQAVNLGVVGSNWHIRGSGDFNGDGIIDILWQDDSGNVAIWLLNGSLQLAQAGGLGAVASAWAVQETGDFNGDAKSDILWRNTTTGDVAIWFMNGLQVSSAALVANVPTTWTIQGANAD